MDAEEQKQFDEQVHQQARKMESEAAEIFDKARKDPTVDDVFAQRPQKDLHARDVFRGDREFFDSIENARRPAETGSQETSSPGRFRIVSTINPTHAILVANVITIAGILVIMAWLFFGSDDVQEGPQAAGPSGDFRIELTSEDTAFTPEGLKINKDSASVLDEGISWKLGNRLFKTRQYGQAAYVFEQLLQNLDTTVPADQYLRDFLKLKIALASYHEQPDEKLNQYYTDALNSRSPVVQAIANYHLGRIELSSGNYMPARMRGYQTLALAETLRDAFSPNFENDCYFLIAEAMTREVLFLHNEAEDFPGELWSNTMAPEELPDMDQSQLRTLLQKGTYQIAEGAVAPKIVEHEYLQSPNQWTAICMDAPLEEFLNKYASSAGFNVFWEELLPESKNRPLTLYLPTNSQQRITEIAAGASDLIARFNLDQVILTDPALYEDLEKKKNLLIAESITTWRRFLLRYRGDHRSPNAHYALAVMEEYLSEPAAALSEYRIVYNQYPHNPLAPYALLNGSRIKTNMKDYAGASRDLNELLIQYPDTKLVDQAQLYLAEATMQSGLYEEAIRRFKKVYNLDVNPQSQSQAAFGLGNSYFQTGQYEDARKWLVQAIGHISDSSDYRLRTAYYLLGKTDLELGYYKEASAALKNAIDTSLSPTEYFDIMLDLVTAQINQEQYVRALQILDSIDASRLSQEQIVERMLARTRIYRMMDLPDTAISLLRRRLEFIANSELRARINLETARCYFQIGDRSSISAARRTLDEALYDLPAGSESHQASLLQVEIALKLDELNLARTTCENLLANVKDKAVRSRASELLGRTFTEMGDHKKAALAYAGVLDELR